MFQEFTFIKISAINTIVDGDSVVTRVVIFSSQYQHRDRQE